MGFLVFLRGGWGGEGGWVGGSKGFFLTIFLQNKFVSLG